METGLDGFARQLADTRSRRSVLKMTAGAIALAAGARIGLGTASASGGNEQFVLDYYDAIQKHSWQTAYNILGGKFHKAKTLDQFIAGFSNTVFTSVEIGNVTGQLAGNKYGVDVVINAWLGDGTPQAFSGRYFIGREGGVAKIVDAKIVVADASGLSPLCFAADLTEDLSANAGTGHRFGDLHVTNQGGACTLVGMPGVSIKDKKNKKIIGGKREANTTMAPVVVDNGQSALLQLDWTNWCGAKISGDVKVAVSLPGATGDFTIAHGFGVPPCIGEAESSSLRIRPWQLA